MIQFQTLWHHCNAGTVDRKRSPIPGFKTVFYTVLNDYAIAITCNSVTLAIAYSNQPSQLAIWYPGTDRYADRSLVDKLEYFLERKIVPDDRLIARSWYLATPDRFLFVSRWQEIPHYSEVFMTRVPGYFRTEVAIVCATCQRQIEIDDSYRMLAIATQGTCYNCKKEVI